MRICIMTAQTGNENGHPEFLGLVIGMTLEECKRKALRKWNWYGSIDAETKYYAGYPRVTTRWMRVGKLIGRYLA